MLTGNRILEAIREGRLSVEPLLKEFQIGPCSLDIRVGTHFQRNAGFDKPIENALIGDHVVVPASASVKFITIETLHLAHDIAGLVVPLNVFSNAGLFVPSTQINPGWQGKLKIGVFNFSGFFQKLIVGERFATIIFFDLQEKMNSEFLKTTDSTKRTIDLLLDLGVLAQHWRETENGQKRAFSIKSETMRVAKVMNDEIRRITYKKSGKICLITLNLVCNEENPQKKGKILEEYVSSLFSGIKGLRIVKKHARLSAEEIDLIIENHMESFLTKEWGTRIIIECKNWSSKVGVGEINNLYAKMKALSPDVKTSILISVNGISGNSYRDAKLRIREYRKEGRYILVLDGKDLERIEAGETIIRVIRDKYDELYLI